MRFCVELGKPWALLLPNYVANKSYYSASLSVGSSSSGSNSSSVSSSSSSSSAAAAAPFSHRAAAGRAAPSSRTPRARGTTTRPSTASGSWTSRATTPRRVQRSAASSRRPPPERSENSSRAAAAVVAAAAAAAAAVLVVVAASSSWPIRSRSCGERASCPQPSARTRASARPCDRRRFSTSWTNYAFAFYAFKLGYFFVLLDFVVLVKLGVFCARFLLGRGTPCVSSGLLCFLLGGLAMGTCQVSLNRGGNGNPPDVYCFHGDFFQEPRCLSVSLWHDDGGALCASLSSLERFGFWRILSLSSSLAPISFYLLALAAAADV